MTAAQRTSIELAGIPDPAGHIGRRFPTEYVVRPDQARLYLDATGEHIVYDTRDPLVSDSIRGDSLDRFLRLVRASPEEIAAYASRYGVLSINAIRDRGIYREPIAVWRHFAERAAATLSLAASIHRGRPLHPRDWATVADWAPSAEAYRSLRKSIADRFRVSDVVNTWLLMAELRPAFSWSQGPVYTNLIGVDEGAMTLLGVLAVQIVQAAGRASQIATCSGCGSTYFRDGRQAARGRANYCRECGVKAAWRDAQARRRSELRRGGK